MKPNKDEIIEQCLNVLKYAGGILESIPGHLIAYLEDDILDEKIDFERIDHAIHDAESAKGEE